MKAMLIALTWIFLVGNAYAQDNKLNFHNRQAIVINTAPKYIQLHSFSFKNEYSRSRFRLKTNLSWKNVSNKRITAFEVVILRYDPFNRPLRSGGRWLITGKNSGDWSPLMPGESSQDGTIGYDSEPVLTSVVYLRAIRFSDGNVWMSNTPVVVKLIKNRLPVLRDLGDVAPSPNKPKK